MRIFCLLFLFLTTSEVLVAATWRVGRMQVYRSIQAAIDKANNGDTVLVATGVYREKNLVINKSIVLKGEHYPVLDGEKKYEVLSVKASHVVVDGFKIISSGISSIIDMGGIKVYDSDHVTIQNNILDDTFFGIYIQYGKHCIVRNNTLNANGVEEQQSGNGIHCWKSDSLQIIGNKVSGHRDGIYFEFVTNSIIWRNTAEKNIRYGLHFMFSNEDTYVSNVFKNNGAGVAVMFSKKVRMFNNYFEENWGDAAYGLLLKELSDSHIEGNTFVKNTTGIFLEGASRIQMKRNSFLNNGWAMKIQASCMEVAVENCNFKGNTFDVGTNGSLVLNTFNGNYWDKYEGYDLNRDKIGDLPYRPVSIYSMIVEKYPTAMLFFRSFMTSLFDKTEKVFPSLTPENLKDNVPRMSPGF